MAKKKDLYYEANASGYLIFYKHRCLGGEKIKGKPRAGYAGRRAKDAWEEKAALQVRLIIEGRGLPRFHNKIDDIEQSFERWKK